MALWLGYANDPLTLNRPVPTRAPGIAGLQPVAASSSPRSPVRPRAGRDRVPLVLLQDDDLSGGDPTMPTARSRASRSAISG